MNIDNLLEEMDAVINVVDETEDELAIKLAQSIKEITEECENGAYPAEIRDELLEDAHEVAKASELAENLDTRIKLEKLYSIIKAIAGAVK